MSSAERLLTRPFLLCALANFTQSLAFNLYLHLPGFLHDLGAGEVQIGVVIATTSVASIAVRPPLGRAIDRYGRHRLILLAGVANIGICLLYLTIDSLGPWTYVVRTLHGLSEAVLFMGLFTVAADWVPASRRTEGLALYSASSMLPISFGGVLGDAILARASYDALFIASACFAALSLLMTIPLEEYPRVRRIDDPPRGIGHALVQRDLAPLWFMGTVFGLVLTGVFVFVKRFVMETQVATVGTFFSAYTGAAILVRLAGGRLPDRVGPKRVLLPALATLVGGFLCLAAARTAAQVLAAGVLCGLGHGFVYPVLSSLVVARASESGRGAAISIHTALPDVGGLFGAPLLGWLIVVRGFSVMFEAAGAMLALGSLIFFGWDRRATRNPADPDAAC
ncbi:MAG: MFS transporter [Proteobacteria bacterium]|nr:MFS transporter [Pseudomonadota bacterium]